MIEILRKSNAVFRSRILRRVRIGAAILCCALFLSLVLPAAGAELAPAPRLSDPGQYISPFAKRQTESSLVVDTSDRASVADFYNTVYQASENIGAEWTGNIDGCDPGVVSDALRAATLQRVNYFRAMTGLPGDIVEDYDWSLGCQETALMMIAEMSLSHYPPDDWACYTVLGAQTASKSNIAIGFWGPASINGYMEDAGTYNTATGHRRWILYPPQIKMGTGSVPDSNGYYHGSNALRVLQEFGPRPSGPEWVSWPPEGYVPYPLFWERWSFSYQGADFSTATVSMTKSGSAVSVTLETVQNGYGDNTLVWKAAGFPIGKPKNDITYSVTVDNVVIGGSPQSFNYEVIAMDPAKVVATPTPTHTPEPTPTPSPTPIPGDLNTDGVLAASDLLYFSPSYGLSSGNENFNPQADINTDGTITRDDVRLWIDLLGN